MTVQTPDPEVIIVTATRGATRGRLQFQNRIYPCALGRSGIVSTKREGDGGTPHGTFALRELRFRSDRLQMPDTMLPIIESKMDDGWCDQPGDPAYNRFVKRPYHASSETFWREDQLYDIVIMLGYNDDPVIDGAGSAIFFHLAKSENGLLQPTEGCVALTRPDMLSVLKDVKPETRMVIQPAI